MNAVGLRLEGENASITPLPTDTHEVDEGQLILSDCTPESTEGDVHPTAATVIENTAVVELEGLAESVTCTVKVEVPIEVAVPEMTPLDVIDKPAGRDPDAKLHVYGWLPTEP